MSINKYLNHVLIIPEDDDDAQIAVGFTTHPACNGLIVIEKYAGGWQKVLDRLNVVHVPEMRSRDFRHVVLLIDFDNQEDRRKKAESQIPDDLKDRVFLVGSWREPQDLKRSLGSSLSEIGALLAQDCAENTDTTWSHELLSHNSDVLARMRNSIRNIVFHN